MIYGLHLVRPEKLLQNIIRRTYPPSESANGETRKYVTFSTEEICLMRTTVNQPRNEKLAKGQYTDAADEMLLKLF